MKKLIGLGLIWLFFSACSTNTPETPQAAAGFVFSADPGSGQVSVTATSGGVTAQATTGERRLEPGTELELVTYTYVFVPGNMLVINAEFKNVSSQVFENVRFERISGDNIDNSTEPAVADMTLEPGESTSSLRFEVMHKGQAFTYAVEAKAKVRSPSESECTDPVNIPDDDLKLALQVALGKLGDVITCSDLESLTAFSVSGNNSDDIYRSLEDLEGLQYAVNLSVLKLESTSIRDLTPLLGLTKLTVLDLSDNRISDIGPLASLENLTTLDLSVNSIIDFVPLLSLPSLDYLDLRATVVTGVSDFSSLSDLHSVASLFIDVNGITDIGFLQNVTTLDTLGLSQNLVEDIGALVANPELGYGQDQIDLTLNCLDLSEGSQAVADIATLEARNPDEINVIFEPQTENFNSAYSCE